MAGSNPWEEKDVKIAWECRLLLVRRESNKPPIILDMKTKIIVKEQRAYGFLCITLQDVVYSRAFSNPISPLAIFYDPTLAFVYRCPEHPEGLARMKR